MCSLLDSPPEPTDACNVLALRQWVDVATTKPPLLARPYHGPAMTFLQPHPDDAALSAGGLISTLNGPISVVTTHALSDSTSETEARHKEDVSWANSLNVDIRHLSLHQSTTHTWKPVHPDDRVKAALPTDIQPGSLVAPAGVGRHPDHAQCHRIAFELGAVAFWEDLAFWGVYGMSSDDRAITALNNDISWILVALDITEALASKAYGLKNYSSQSTDTWRPIRHAWTAAREVVAPFRFAERYFLRGTDNAESWIQSIGYKTCHSSTITYGTRELFTICAGKA